jgi:hypothetical protein
MFMPIIILKRPFWLFPIIMPRDPSGHAHNNGSIGASDDAHNNDYIDPSDHVHNYGCICTLWPCP